MGRITKTHVALLLW